MSSHLYESYIQHYGDLKTRYIILEEYLTT